MFQQFSCQHAAVFSDIHGNLPAFQACFQDALRHGADLFLFLGDYVSDLSGSRQVLDLVYQIQETYPTICLRGNRERYMLACAQGRTQFSPGSKSGSLLYTYQQLTAKDLAFFERIPISAHIRLSGIPVEIAHAARTDDHFYFDEEDGSIDGILAQMDTPYLLAGHSHRQFLFQHDGKAILNPGSIGVPKRYGPLAQYAMLHMQDGHMTFDLHQIPYDVPSVIRQQFQSSLMQLAPHWAISILYDIITGEDYTLLLLERVGPDTHCEAAWHKAAAQLGMRFTQQDILDFYTSHCP